MTNRRPRRRLSQALLAASSESNVLSSLSPGVDPSLSKALLRSHITCLLLSYRREAGRRRHRLGNAVWLRTVRGKSHAIAAWFRRNTRGAKERRKAGPIRALGQRDKGCCTLKQSIADVLLKKTAGVGSEVWGTPQRLRRESREHVVAILDLRRVTREAGLVLCGIDRLAVDEAPETPTA